MKITTRCMIVAAGLLIATGACGSDEQQAPSSGTSSLPTAVTNEENVDMVRTTPTAPSLRVAPIDAQPSESPPVDLKTMLAKAKAASLSGEHDTALKLFEQLVDEQPDNLKLTIEFSRALIHAGNFELAADRLADSAKHSESSYAWNTMGRALLGAGKYVDAVTAFEAAVEFDPDNPYAWNNLGLTHIRFSAFDKAVAPLEQATKHAKATNYMWNNLGIAYERTHEIEAAIEAYAKAEALGSSKAKLHLERLQEQPSDPDVSEVGAEDLDLPPEID